MDKKLTLICGAIVLLAAAFIYMSFSPNTAPVSAPPTVSDNSPNLKNNPPPPPPPRGENKRQTTAPPPPPIGLRKAAKKAVELPEGYINYEVLSRPEPVLELKKGSTTQVVLDVKKGSEDFTIEWFKKGSGSLKKVNVGKTFSVSPESTVVYYMATIDDKVNEPQNIFFQVEPELESATNTETPPFAKIKDEAPKPVAEAPQIKEEPMAAKEVEPAPEEPVKTEKFVIKATKNTTVNARAGTPLSIGYKVEGDESYKVFWFHKPYNRKKGALIKKRTKLNFSLKKLNKYHSGYFYIQIKDSAGKLYKSPEYKVTVK